MHLVIAREKRLHLVRLKPMARLILIQKQMVTMRHFQRLMEINWLMVIMKPRLKPMETTISFLKQMVI